MAKAVGLAGLLFAVVFVAKACSPFGGASAFSCDNDLDCQSQGTSDGKCEPNGFCSFLDGSCPSGRRYGDLAGGNLSSVCVGDEPPSEAGVDTPDAPQPEAGEVCFGAVGGLARPCFAMPPSGAITLDAAIDTTTSPLCSTAVSNTTACVIAGETITLNLATTVKVTGTRPLVLVATSSITINGALDAASNRGSLLIGAAGNDAACDPGIVPGQSAGGAGGSFGGAGGNGASGLGGAPAGTAGAAAANVTTLRGGCRGQDGKEGSGGAATRGIGGNGGGALYLIAGASITVGATGAINASGGGATGGAQAAAGAGGGGSGGTIGFDAPTVTNGGIVFANGGGGGEGSGNTTVGDVGDDPGGPTAASGGAGGSATGGDGGLGAAGANANGTNGTAGTNGGGGAGGGAGLIRVIPAQAIGGQVSPAAT